MRDLFTPLGPGIDIGGEFSEFVSPAASDRLVAWRTLGVASRWPANYRAQRTNRPLIDGYVARLTQSISAADLRGTAIRLRGRVRVAASDWSGVAALRLTVERSDRDIDFFGMENRPIRDAAWREYTVEGRVSDDAITVTAGLIASGAATADFDAVMLEARRGTGQWTSVPLTDGDFEAPATQTSWKPDALSKHIVVSRPDRDAPEGRQFLRVAPPNYGSEQAEAQHTEALTRFGDAWRPSAGANTNFDLGRGIRARVRLALTELEARSTIQHPSKELEMLRRTISSTAGVSQTPDVATRLADVTVAWNVLRHFYPYLSEVDVNWDTRLRAHVKGAYAAKTRRAHQDALRVLVADARDGHGHVLDTLRSDDHWPPFDVPQIPVAFGFIEGRVVVTASEISDEPQ